MLSDPEEQCPVWSDYLSILHCERDDINITPRPMTLVAPSFKHMAIIVLFILQLEDMKSKHIRYQLCIGSV